MNIRPAGHLGILLLHLQLNKDKLLKIKNKNKNKKEEKRLWSHRHKKVKFEPKFSRSSSHKLMGKGKQQRNVSIALKVSDMSIIQ